MKILLFSDVHWGVNSSIVRGRGQIFSIKLEHLINSMNWINKLAVDKACSLMICAGDFFDKPVCNDEEITALQSILWNNLTCYFLCGNHESSTADLRFSSLKALEASTRIVIDKPLTIDYNQSGDKILFLPYITEVDRKPITEYFKESSKTSILITHADIKGINYGGFESKIGFSMEELEMNSALCLNGHLHNAGYVSKGILNLGSLTAHNFTNDSARYSYGAWILDTDTMQIEFIENPYSLNFYKFDISTEADLKSLSKIKSNAVLSIKYHSELKDKLMEALQAVESKIIDKRLTVIKANTNIEITISELHSDHLAKLVSCCKEHIANTDILNAELAEICK